MMGARTGSARVLLTGVTGFVGKVVLQELLRRRDELGIDGVDLLIRPRRRRTPEERFEAQVANSPAFARLERGWRELCHPVAGDIVVPGLGLAPEDAAALRSRVTHVIHCAASVRFDLPVAEAALVNVTGALDALAFAKTCPRLRRMVDVSTAYVTPHPGDGVPIEETLVALPFDADELYASIVAGRADERELLAVSGHANTYTLTKCLAEILLARRREDVPLTLLRPSIVSACRRHPFPGWIDSRAAYAAVVALLGAGHLRAVRIDPRVRVDLVACDDVADRILTCAFAPELQQPFVIRHAVSGLRNSGTLHELSRSHERYFRAHPHERPARWAYAGPSTPLFRLNEWLHHDVPLRLAHLGARLRRRRRHEARIGRLSVALGSVDRLFHYFGHHAFDFRTAFPPLDDFDLPAYLDTISEGVSHHLLKRDPKHAPLRMHGTDAEWALSQPGGGGATVRTVAYFVRKVLRKGAVQVTFDEAAIKRALAEARQDDLVVLAPSHRSYMDFLVISLLSFAHPGLRLRLPKVAATDDFARIPVVGSVLKACGAFYIRRGLGEPDPKLNAELGALVDGGHALEFYPEGQRSRTRRFIAPKRGLLRALQATGRRTVVLPLSISYDRICEEQGFLGELEGHGRHKGGLKPLAKWLTQLARGKVRTGRIHIGCGRALPLEPGSDVPALADDLIAELQRTTVSTTFHLRSFCERHRELGVSPASLRAAVTARGGVVIPSRLGVRGIAEPVHRTFEAHWMHLFYAEALQRHAGHAAVAAHVRRNGFWMPPAPPATDPVSEGVVDALFAPIARDYARVAEAVADMPEEGWSSLDVVKLLPGVFLREADDALAELADAGVLEHDGGVYRRAEGAPPAADFARRWAWTGAGAAAGAGRPEMSLH